MCWAKKVKLKGYEFVCAHSNIQNFEIKGSKLQMRNPFEPAENVISVGTLPIS